MNELILRELKEIKELLQVIVSNQEQDGNKNIYSVNDPKKTPNLVGTEKDDEVIHVDKNDHILTIPTDHIFIKAAEAEVYLNRVAADDEEAKRIAELLAITSKSL